MQCNLNSKCPHPQVNIPPGARQPVNPPLVEQYAPYTFEVSPTQTHWTITIILHLLHIQLHSKAITMDI